MRHRHAILAITIAALVVVASPASAEWKEKVLYSFQGGKTDGALPAGGVVFDAAGNLYGATTEGGGDCPPAGCGTVFRLAPPVKKGDPWTETVLYIFKGHDAGDGAAPAGGLLIDGSGNLYGSTAYGGTGSCTLLGTPVGCGTVFELSPTGKGNSWTETVLYSFQGGLDGYVPMGDLVFDSVGKLYGATYYGGGYGSCNAGFYQYCGTVFEMSPPKKQGGKWKEKVLYSFKGGKDGANPNGGLVFDSKGAIYGTTAFGGNDRQQCKLDQGTGCGTVFKLELPASNVSSWNKSVIYRFKSTPDGAGPATGVILDKDGNLYGTTVGGGIGGGGTLVKLAYSKTRGRWIEKVLYTFTGGSDGENPRATLAFDAKGNLWGTALGGAYFRGTLFRLLRNHAFSLTYAFEGVPDGAYPAGDLILDRSGNLYGTTQGGGTGQACQGGCGTVVEVSPY